MSFSETDNDDGMIVTYSIQQTLNFTRDLNTFNSKQYKPEKNQSGKLDKKQVDFEQ